MGTQVCKTILDYSSSGSMPFWYSLRDCIPFAFEGLLLCILIILFAGNYFLVKQKTGRVKILSSMVASTFVMITLSMMLALAQLVSYITVILYAFLSIISFILLWISDDS